MCGAQVGCASAGAASAPLPLRSSLAHKAVDLFVRASPEFTFPVLACHDAFGCFCRAPSVLAPARRPASPLRGSPVRATRDNSSELTPAFDLQNYMECRVHNGARPRPACPCTPSASVCCLRHA